MATTDVVIGHKPIMFRPNQCPTCRYFGPRTDGKKRGKSMMCSLDPNEPKYLYGMAVRPCRYWKSWQEEDNGEHNTA